MLHNLLSEMARNGVKNQDIANVIGINTKTVYNKIHGMSGFTLNDAVVIRDKFFPGMNLEYLFANTSDD